MKIKDSKTNTIKELNVKDKFNIYICGPTVYDYMHIGNARPIITYDLLHRLLKFKGVKVNFIHNITDIDDKIIEKAEQEKTTEQQIAKKYTDSYKEELKLLNILPSIKMPTVIDNMDEIINTIKLLIENKSAYVKEGSVYFSIASLNTYGEISNINLKDVISTSKEVKEDDHDFALWKKTTKGIKFDSPWSKGRPGWHTECVSLIMKYFGNQTIDLHGGGIDLKFPHHENENAQWKSINGSELAKVWSHVGQINIENKKMSKSIGNVVLIKDYIKEYSPNHLRMLMYHSSYTTPLNITEDLNTFINNEINKIISLVFKRVIESEINNKLITKIPNQDVINTIGNDLNISNAFSFLESQMKGINKDINSDTFYDFINNLLFLGFNFLAIMDKPLIKKYKEQLKNKNYEQSDKVRTEIFKKINGGY